MIIAFTGAGISKSSGIPTFQDQPGIKDKLRLGDTLLVVGASDYTWFATQARLEALAMGASVVEIQDNTDEKVWAFLDRRADELR